jgi:hypothetical protein
MTPNFWLFEVQVCGADRLTFAKKAPRSSDGPGAFVNERTSRSYAAVVLLLPFLRRRARIIRPLTEANAMPIASHSEGSGTGAISGTSILPVLPVLPVLVMPGVSVDGGSSGGTESPLGRDPDGGVALTVTTVIPGTSEAVITATETGGTGGAGGARRGAASSRGMVTAVGASDRVEST